jgi:hypothetical protein
MISKWFHLKQRAITLRKAGHSINDVENKLRIPKSTLSGWFRNVTLTKKQKAVLLQRWKQGLQKARKGAVLWHNQQKKDRILNAEKEAMKALSLLDVTDKATLELALAILYLGEGSKKNLGTNMGNSDPLILRFFIFVLRKNYNFDMNKIRCELHLRADQNPKKIQAYWSKELGIPLRNFTSISVDKRTRGSITYPEYKGVCVLSCGTVAIQRKLVYLSRMFCEKVVSQKGG